MKDSIISVICCGIIGFSMVAQASDFPYLWDDPLHTLPDTVLKNSNGVLLDSHTKSSRNKSSQYLSLSEAVDVALSNSPKIKAAWADIKTQAAALGTADSTFWPTISGTLNWTRDDLQYSDQPSMSTNTAKFNAQASFNWRLYDFGARSANKVAAKDSLAAALSSRDDVIQTVLTNVIQCYFNAVISKADFTAKEKIESIAKETLDSARRREAKGIISQSDTLRAATALARATLEKNRAHGVFQKNLAMLRQSLGIAGFADLELPPEMPVLSETTLERQNLALWLEEARKNHPAVLAARKKFEAANDQVAVAKAVGLPNFNMSATYYNNTSPGVAATVSPAQEYTLIFGVTIPFFNGFASTYKVQDAKSQVDKARATLEEAEQQVSLAIVKSYADSISALGNLDASKNLLDLAEKSLSVMQRRYDKGDADISDVLSVQSSLADAYGERIRCLAEWNSSRLQLLTAIGKLDRSSAGF